MTRFASRFNEQIPHDVSIATTSISIDGPIAYVDSEVSGTNVGSLISPYLPVNDRFLLRSMYEFRGDLISNVQIYAGATKCPHGNLVWGLPCSCEN